MTAQIGPSDSIIDVLIADHVALGSAPCGVSKESLSNSLSAAWRWSERVAVEYECVWWDAEACIGC